MAWDKTLEQSWRARRQSDTELAIDSTALRETALATFPPREEAWLPDLLDKGAGDSAPIELGDELGRGGMGVVFSATQTTIGRTVAVKALLPEVAHPDQALQLLREGRVTGLLEHPNVVPVHTLGHDGEGRPLIVMKRIDGTPWLAKFADATGVQRTSAAFLREHLGVLQQVARAVHFAHTRGVLHRDIKPDNVMIGAFGEVYVVDWGIAVSLANRDVAGVPRAADVRNVEGTPVFMAPEMAASAGELLSVRSDVYLLGATMHELLTGTAPHDAEGIREVLLKAFQSKPPVYSDGVPEELQAIARRAMAREAIDRYPSAAAFADALDDFLLHWSSHELCDEGERRTRELADLQGELAREEEVERLFHEARFAFAQALRGWPENTRATKGRRKLLELMVRFELRRGNPQVAEGLLRQHDDAPQALEARVEKAIARLATLERDADLSFGLRERLYRVYIGSTAWMVLTLAYGFLTRSGIYEIDHWRFAAVGLTFTLGSLLSLIVWRVKVLANATNLSVAITSLMVFGSGVILWPVLGTYGLTMPQITTVAMVVNACLWGTLCVPLGKAWLPLPIGNAVVAVLAWWIPTYHFELMALNGVMAVVAGKLVEREAQRAQEPSSLMA